ncbi:MAG: glycosyltransferase family 4 protein, partial [Dehalococcoidia bacterium]
MRVLVNATSKEIDRLGGDFTLYRDWLRLTRSGLDFVSVPSHPIRHWNVNVRKGLERGCRTFQPRWLRRRLFLASRYLHVMAGPLKGVDLLFSHLLFPWTRSRPAVPIVWSSQGISPREYYERYNRGQWNVEDVAFVYRTLGRRSSALVIPTEACAENVVRWCPELAGRVYVVPAPVFSDNRSPVAKPSKADGVIRLLFVGVDAARKGLPEVVEAMGVLGRRYKHLRLDIVSRPTPQLRRRIEAVDGVRLYISSPEVDVKALMSQADVFVLPTHADTYALAAVEAMAHSCAVVISDLEPLPEIVPQ